MCVCVCVYTHIHTHTLHTCIHTYMHTYMHIFIHTLHACKHTYIHTFIIHSHIHARIHTYIHSCMHARTHARTNTHIIHTNITYIHAKGAITKEYFPVVAERLKMKINFTQNFTTIVTGHDNIRSYLHRFKIIETPICPCGTTEQTIDHLLFECELINKERDNLTF